MNEIEQKLNELAEFHSYLDNIRGLVSKLKEEAVPEVVRQRLREIDAEFSESLEQAQLNISEKENEIKQAVLAEGKSVKGDFMQAVYMSAKVTWDNKGLDGIALVHPEILKLRKVGEPYVQLRFQGKKS